MAAGDSSIPPRPRFKRILLKLSGEALQGDLGHGICPATLTAIAQEVRDVQQMGVQLALVVGGGNIFRGLQQSAAGMNRVDADNMGMLATVINSLALQDALEHLGVSARVLSAIALPTVAEAYAHRTAVEHLECNRVVIFGAGTGNPYFTTDTAAALRALEIGADVMLKATKVDGVYSADPVKDSKAVFFSHLTYLDVLNRGLRVMDATAVSLCMENSMPLIVFNLNAKGNIKRVVAGENVGSLVTALRNGAAT